MAILFGPHPFNDKTEDIILPSYFFPNTDWQSDGQLWVVNATKDVRALETGATKTGYWQGAVLTTQEIKATIKVGSAADSYPGLIVRRQGVGTYYLAEWDKQDGEIIIYRVVSSEFTVIGSGGTVNSNTTYTNCYIYAEGTGATVTIRVGDAQNGEVFNFGDTNAARLTSGTPGMSIYEENAGTSAIDDVQISDAFTGDGGSFSTTNATIMGINQISGIQSIIYI